MNALRKTRTGSFAIGFRRILSKWQNDLPSVLAWSRENSFGHIDLGGDADIAGPHVLDAGMSIGSADLGGWDDWQALLSPAADRRKRAVEKNDQIC